MSNTDRYKAKGGPRQLSARDESYCSGLSDFATGIYARGSGEGVMFRRELVFSLKRLDVM